jgi:hypothetical protein
LPTFAEITCGERHRLLRGKCIYNSPYGSTVSYICRARGSGWGKFAFCQPTTQTPRTINTVNATTVQNLANIDFCSRWPTCGRRLCCESIPLTLFVLIFQDPHDGDDGVPVSCCCRDAEEFVNLAEIADGFHVAAIDSEDELAVGADHTHEPLSAGRK